MLPCFMAAHAHLHGTSAATHTPTFGTAVVKDTPRAASHGVRSFVHRSAPERLFDCVVPPGLAASERELSFTPPALCRLSAVKVGAHVLSRVTSAQKQN